MNQNQQNQSFGPECPTFACEGTTTETGLLHQELAGQKAHNLRLASEFELFTRRSRHENTLRAASQKDAFLRELLPVMDQLERALATGAIPGEPQFRQQVELASQQLRQFLSHHGVK